MLIRGATSEGPLRNWQSSERHIGDYFFWVSQALRLDMTYSRLVAQRWLYSCLPSVLLADAIGRLSILSRLFCGSRNAALGSLGEHNSRPAHTKPIVEAETYVDEAPVPQIAAN